MDRDDIQLLMDKPRDYLLLELAAGGHDAFPRAPLKRGDEIYRSIRRSLREAICSDPRVVALNDGESHAPELVAAIADIVASATVGIPPFAVAVLLLRDGLPKFCAEAD